MTPLEQGFLLLTSHLGNPERRPLTIPQLRTLAHRVTGSARCTDVRDLHPSDLRSLGYGREDAARIISLLDDTELLSHYVSRGAAVGCYPLTRISRGYPAALQTRLGIDAPPCLWYKGSRELLSVPAVGLVGSRELDPANRHFACESGRQAAMQGYAIVSGNAKGADRTAQDACLQQGGTVLSVVADALTDKPFVDRMLYISEDSYDLPFSPLRALSRNRVIHTLGQCTLVAQSHLQSGGSWDGSVKNLRNNWSPLYCFQDNSDASNALQDRGAVLIGLEDLRDFPTLCQSQPSLFHV